MWVGNMKMMGTPIKMRLFSRSLELETCSLKIGGLCNLKHKKTQRQFVAGLLCRIYLIATGLFISGCIS